MRENRLHILYHCVVFLVLTHTPLFNIMVVESRHWNGECVVASNIQYSFLFPSLNMLSVGWQAYQTIRKDCFFYLRFVSCAIHISLVYEFYQMISAYALPTENTTLCCYRKFEQPMVYIKKVGSFH